MINVTSLIPQASRIIKKCDMSLPQSVSDITKCVRCNKVWETVIRKCIRYQKVPSTQSKKNHILDEKLIIFLKNYPRSNLKVIQYLTWTK